MTRSSVFLQGRSHVQRVSVLGVFSLAFGLLALAFMWPPSSGLAAAVLALIGLLVGVTGLVVSRAGRRESFTFPVAGLAISLLALGVASTTFVLHIADHAREDSVRSHIRGRLVPAVERYRMKHDEQLPATLEDLLQDPLSGLDAEALIDPWGKPYQYSGKTVEDHPDGFEIWTTTPAGTRIDNGAH